jgi:hypothetical protein
LQVKEVCVKFGTELSYLLNFLKIHKMRFLPFFVLLLFSSTLFAQVATIDIDLENKRLKKDNREVHLIESDDLQLLYGFFPILHEDKYYQLYAFNQDFEVIENIAKINLGADGDWRDIYMFGEYIISAKTDIDGVYNSNFSLFKTSIKQPDYAKNVTIEFEKREKLIAANESDDKYHVITLNNKGLMKMYTIDVKTLEYTKKKIEGNYKVAYNNVVSFIPQTMEFVQIDADKFFDLQATSSNVQSYFIDNNYILSTEETGKNIVYIVDLKTGALSIKSFTKLYINRTSILHNNRYYVLEADGLTMSLKIFDFENAQLLKTFIYQKGDAILPFQSTAVFDGVYEIPKAKKVMRKFSNGSTLSKSFGLIPETQDSTTILTFGIARYKSAGGTYNGTQYQSNGSTKVLYKYGRTSLMYYGHITFESWINPDGTIIPFEKEAIFQSNYQKIFKLLDSYSARINYAPSNYTQFSVFQFNGKWYFGCYDIDKKRYLIKQI